MNIISIILNLVSICHNNIVHDPRASVASVINVEHYNISFRRVYALYVLYSRCPFDSYILVEEAAVQQSDYHEKRQKNQSIWHDSHVSPLRIWKKVKTNKLIVT
jgi:hypothetical protein